MSAAFFQDGGWEALVPHLEALAPLDADARALYLADIRTGDPALANVLVGVLAAGDDLDSFLDDPLGGWARDLVTEARERVRSGAPASEEHRGTDDIGAAIGPFCPISVLGRGGMGTVYLAERTDGGFAQRVALKVLARPDAAGTLAARFARERQILAHLTHPGIAGLIDGGLTDRGLPWFAMELVDGSSVTDHAQQRRLDVTARLELFRQTCTAVAYAHRHLVVHRDLKPSNILVTADGSVKLVDFGIAKLLEDDGARDLTLPGPRPLTPRYAAPEQIRGHTVTTATDTFSLGVVLYELLSGRTPYGKPDDSEHDVAQAVLELDPIRWDAPLGDDLWTIVVKCLRKDPARRYASVDALLDDVDRHLAGLPVLARAPSFRYVLGKFVRRHRTAVVGATLVVLTLVGGLVGTIWQARRANEQADRARRSVEFLVDLFAAADPSVAQGRTMTAADVLARGRRRLATELVDQPRLRAELMLTVGDLLAKIGAAASAETVLTRALAETEEAFGDDADQTALAADRLGGVYYNLGRHDEAETAYRRAYGIYRRRHGSDHPLTAGSLANIAGVLSKRGDLERAEEIYRQVLVIDRALYPEDDPELAIDMNNLAVNLDRQGRPAEADSLHVLALALRRRRYGEIHADVATSYHNRASVLEDLGMAADAEAHYRKALEIRRVLYPNGDADVAGTLTSLGTLLRGQGRLDEAREALVEAAEVNRSVYQGPHFELGRSYNALGILAYSRGRFDEAASWFGEASDVWEATIGDDDPAALRTRNNLAVALHRSGHLDEALVQFTVVLAARKRVLGADSFEMSFSYKGLGMLQLDREQLAEADSLLALAYGMFATRWPDDNPSVAEVRLGLGGCRLAQRRFAEAESLLVGSYEALAAAYDPEHDLLRKGRRMLRELFAATGRVERLEAYAEPQR